MFKKSIKLFVAIVMMAGFTTKTMAQPGVSDTKSNDARAEILTAITLTTVTPLEFGGMALTVPASTGTVELTPALPTVSTPTNIWALGNVVQTAGYYTLTGTPSTLYTITVPTAPVTISSLSTPTDQMTVDNFTFASVATPSVTGGTIDATGNDAFYVGGRLNVGANQPGGTYVGSFDVTVAY